MNPSIELTWQIFDTFDRHLDDLKERDIVFRSTQNKDMLTKMYLLLDASNKTIFEIQYPAIYRFICDKVVLFEKTSSA